MRLALPSLRKSGERPPKPCALATHGGSGTAAAVH
jgi:hypothetical protein